MNILHSEWTYNKMLKNPKYVYGDMDDVSIPMKINFSEYMIKTLLEHGDKVAIVNAETGESKSYKQIANDAVSVALSLTRMGIGKGQTVAICTENHVDFWSAFLGASSTGAVVTMINFTYTEGEMRHVMNICKPELVICSQLALDIQEDNFKTLNFIKKIIVFGDEYRALCAHGDNGAGDASRFEARDVRGQSDVILVLYSSGTTGLPKGVMLTHWNVLSAISCTFKKEPPKTIPVEDVSLTFAPWFHALGLISMLGAMKFGRKIVFLPIFELHLYLDSIQKYKIAVITVVPPLLVLLTKIETEHDLSSIKNILTGAAPLSRNTIDAVKNKFPNVQVYQGYGLTECTLAVTMDNPDDENKPVKLGSVGTVVPGIVVKVVDIETREPLGPNKSGEICIKGPTVMHGYIGKDTREDFDDEGFFRTGDIGYYDDDKFFYIVDRLKELIKYKAFQVAPAEIEAVLLTHEAVRDAGVVGVKDKDSNEVPLAFVALQPDKNATEQEIKDFVAKKLSNPKHLRGGVRFVDDIPKNPSGKILRKQLRIIANTPNSKL